jgi:hypothetical protein
LEERTNSPDSASIRAGAVWKLRAAWEAKADKHSFAQGLEVFCARRQAAFHLAIWAAYLREPQLAFDAMAESVRALNFDTWYVWLPLFEEMRQLPELEPCSRSSASPTTGADAGGRRCVGRSAAKASTACSCELPSDGGAPESYWNVA